MHSHRPRSRLRQTSSSARRQQFPRQQTRRRTPLPPLEPNLALWSGAGTYCRTSNCAAWDGAASFARSRSPFLLLFLRVRRTAAETMGLVYEIVSSATSGGNFGRCNYIKVHQRVRSLRQKIAWDCHDVSERAVCLVLWLSSRSR